MGFPLNTDTLAKHLTVQEYLVQEVTVVNCATNLGL